MLHVFNTSVPQSAAGVLGDLGSSRIWGGQGSSWQVRGGLGSSGGVWGGPGWFFLIFRICRIFLIFQMFLIFCIFRIFWISGFYWFCRCFWFSGFFWFFGFVGFFEFFVMYGRIVPLEIVTLWPVTRGRWSLLRMPPPQSSLSAFRLVLSVVSEQKLVDHHCRWMFPKTGPIG